MSEAFEDFMESWAAILEGPTQFGAERATEFSATAPGSTDSGDDHNERRAPSDDVSIASGLAHSSAARNGLDARDNAGSRATTSAPIDFSGDTLERLDATATRVLAADRVIARMLPCPQGNECCGDGKHLRVFECEQGCGFIGCAMCIDSHEAEPHWNGSLTT